MGSLGRRYPKLHGVALKLSETDAEGEMKNKPFLDIFLVFLLVALTVANAWDFFFRAEHPLSSIVTSLLAFGALVVGFAHVFRKKAQ